MKIKEEKYQKKICEIKMSLKKEETK